MVPRYTRFAAITVSNGGKENTQTPALASIKSTGKRERLGKKPNLPTAFTSAALAGTGAPLVSGLSALGSSESPSTQNVSNSRLTLPSLFAFTLPSVDSQPASPNIS